MKVSTKDLIVYAKTYMENAYAPYSNFRVGSAMVNEFGDVFVGCNVENASYGATMCAERSAIFQAVSYGSEKIQEIVIVTPTKLPTAPCGLCRQVINEFASKNIKITSVALKSGKKKSWTLKKLLPDAFGPQNLRIRG